NFLVTSAIIAPPGNYYDRYYLDFGCASSLTLTLCFGASSVLCRVEWDRQWYVVMKDLRFHLHRKETYKVEIEL
ncbi:DUF5348 domain-containing protein, partial [Ammoniphilus resinae]